MASFSKDWTTLRRPTTTHKSKSGVQTASQTDILCVRNYASEDSFILHGREILCHIHVKEGVVCCDQHTKGQAKPSVAEAATAAIAESCQFECFSGDYKAPAF
jgi:hypothetical protein